MWRLSSTEVKALKYYHNIFRLESHRLPLFYYASGTFENGKVGPLWLKPQLIDRVTLYEWNTFNKKTS